MALMVSSSNFGQIAWGTVKAESTPLPLRRQIWQETRRCSERRARCRTISGNKRHNGTRFGDALDPRWGVYRRAYFFVTPVRGFVTSNEPSSLARSLIQCAVVVLRLAILS